MKKREQRANQLFGEGLQGGSTVGGSVCARVCVFVSERLSVLIKVQTDAVERSKNSQKGLKTAGYIPLSHTLTHNHLYTHTSCCSNMVNESLLVYVQPPTKAHRS